MVQESDVIGISEVSAVGKKDSAPLKSPAHDLIEGKAVCRRQLQVSAITIVFSLAVKFSFNQFLPDSLCFMLFKFTNGSASEAHCLVQFF